MVQDAALRAIPKSGPVWRLKSIEALGLDWYLSHGDDVLRRRYLRRIRNSCLLDSVLELGRTSGAVTISPGSFSGWDEVFASGAIDYILQPGDYRHWGLGRPRRAADSTARHVIRMADSTRPWDRPGAAQALVRGFDFEGQADWIVSGLTIDGRALDRPLQQLCHVGPGSTGIVFDSLHVVGAPIYAVRLSGSGCVVQRCLLEGPATVAGAGVEIKATGRGPSTGNRILDCEIVDFSDGVLVSGISGGPYPGIDETVIDGNDVYVSRSRYFTDELGISSDLENGIDLKTGADDPLAPVVISRNRLWGFRRTRGDDGAAGAAVTIHRGARNIALFDNVILDCPIGIQEVSWKQDGSEPYRGPRGVAIEGNLFWGIQKFHEDDFGVVFRNWGSFVVAGNLISTCGGVSALKGRPNRDWFAYNSRHETPLGPAAADWTARTSNRDVNRSELRHVRIERRRWTGPYRTTLRWAALRRAWGRNSRQPGCCSDPYLWPVPGPSEIETS